MHYHDDDVAIPISDRPPDTRQVKLRLNGFHYEERYSIAWYSGEPTVELFVAIEVPERDGRVTHDIRVHNNKEFPLRQWKALSPAQRAAEARRLCLDIITHELDEAFFQDGVRVFDPHLGDLQRQKLQRETFEKPPPEPPKPNERKRTKPLSKRELLADARARAITDAARHRSYQGRRR